MDSGYIYNYVYQVKRVAKDSLCSDFNHEISSPNASESRLNKFRYAVLDLAQPDPVNHLVYTLKQKLFQHTELTELNPSWNQSVPLDHQLQLLRKIADVANIALAEAKDGDNRRAIQICVILTIKRRIQRAESDGIMEQQCVICLTEFKNLYEVRKLPCDCKHFYHEACVWTWVEKNRTCPMCRCDFTCKPAATKLRRLCS